MFRTGFPHPSQYLVIDREEPALQAWLLDAEMVDYAIPSVPARRVLVFETTEIDAGFRHRATPGIEN